MSRRRICVFCDKWASGGIESFLTGVLLRQDMGEMEINLVTAALSESVYTERLQAHGVRLVCLSGSVWRLTDNWNRFRRLLKARKYDVVYVNTFQALSLRYGLLARRAGVPVRILHSHSTDIRKQPSRFLKLIIHGIAKGLYGGVGTEYFACSHEAAAFLFPPKRRVRFLPNGIDTQRFRFREENRSFVRRELGLEDKLILGNIGRLVSQKNQMFLLDVLKAVLPARPEACLLLVGEGELREVLEKRAEELDLRESVLFYGVTDKPEELLCAMDAFLFPSLFEGLGIAAVEAQCAGLPLLCSEHVPPEALVTDLAKRLPLTGGAEAWARAAASIEPPEDRERYAAAVKEAGFDVEDVSRVLRDVFMGMNRTEIRPSKRFHHFGE